MYVIPERIRARSSEAECDSEAWISNIRIEFSILHEAVRIESLGMWIDSFVT
jgi:hypothetical protein